MNLCTISVLLCLLIDLAAGYMTGDLKGPWGAMIGVTLGAMIAGASIFAMVSLERAAARRQGAKAVMPFVLFTIVAMVAPFGSGILTVMATRAIAPRFDPTDNYFGWALVPALVLAVASAVGTMGPIRTVLCFAGAAAGGVTGGVVFVASSAVNDFWAMVFGGALILVAGVTLTIVIVRKRAAVPGEEMVEPDEPVPAKRFPENFDEPHFRL